MKEMKPLFVGILAGLLTMGTVAGATINNELKRTNANTNAQPLVLEVINGEKSAFSSGMTTTSLGSKIKTKANIGKRDDAPQFFAMKAWANQEKIGNISSFELTLDGGVNVNTFSYKYGFETKDNQPFYNNEVTVLSATGTDITTVTVNFKNDLKLVSNPNYLSIWSKGWKAVKSFKIYYGDNSQTGNSQCASEKTPMNFSTNKYVDFIDTELKDIKMDIIKAGHFEAIISKPKAGLKFKVTADGEDVRLNKKLDTNYFDLNFSTKIATLKKDVADKIIVIVGANQTVVTSLSFEVIDTTEVTYHLFGNNFGGGKSNNWGDYNAYPANLVPEKIGDTIIWKNFSAQGNANIGMSTNLQIRDNGHPYKTYKTLDSSQDPTIAAKNSSNFAIVLVGQHNFDITFNVKTGLILVSLSK